MPELPSRSTYNVDAIFPGSGGGSRRLVTLFFVNDVPPTILFNHQVRVLAGLIGEIVKLVACCLEDFHISFDPLTNFQEPHTRMIGLIEFVNVTAFTQRIKLHMDSTFIQS